MQFYSPDHSKKGLVPLAVAVLLMVALSCSKKEKTENKIDKRIKQINKYKEE